MSAPLATFCIPTYNRPEYLRRAIQSCLGQTFSDFEIIITDNSTNEDSAKMAASINDPRIRYYSNNGNIGSTASFNRAVSLVRGKYAQTLMDDDLVKPKFLELMVAAFEKHPTVGVVMAPMALIDEEDRRIYPKFQVFRTMRYRYRYQVGDEMVGRKRILRDFLTRDYPLQDYPCCVPSGIMYRMDALRGMLPFRDEADFAGDLYTCMRIATDWDFYYIDEVLSAWRYTPVSHTARQHSAGFKIQAWYFITRQILENKAVQEMFREEWDKVLRDSYFFCTYRSALLNGLAALRARSPRLLLKTYRDIRQEDPYWLNLLRLPFRAARDVVTSLFPPQQPLARE